MKIPIGLMIVVFLFFICAGIYTKGHDSVLAQEKKQTIEENFSKENNFVERNCENLEQTNFVKKLIEDKPESEISWSQMVKETAALWKLFLDKDGAPFNDPRRDKLETYAEYLTDIVITYQNKETDIGGRLPKHENTHLMIAWLYAKESSLDATVVGKSHGEVGLGQLHGVALAGIEPEIVRSKPKLGIYLSVRWLASKLPICYPNGIKDEDWVDGDWLGPLTVYGGKNPLNKDGTCKIFNMAREKVKKMQMFRAWINADLVNEIDPKEEYDILSTAKKM